MEMSIGEQPEVYVMDAAFYTEKNLKQCRESINWISRVPLTIKAAQELTKILLPEQFIQSNLYKAHNCYAVCSVCSEYAGIKTRWIIVESELGRDADLKSLSKRIEQSLRLKTKAIKKLPNKEFACEADALIAAKYFKKAINYHRLYQVKVLAKPHHQRR